MNKKKVKIPFTNGYEYDYLTGWRKYLKKKAGVAKYIKKNYNKRLRRALKRELK